MHDRLFFEDFSGSKAAQALRAILGKRGEKSGWKLNLSKRLYRRGYSEQDILKLLLLLDRMMGLPESLELIFRNELKQFEEENQMTYMSSFERIGRQSGRQEGRMEERQDIIRSLLVSRFDVIDEELETIIEPLTELPTAEFSRLLLSLSTLSREELLARFG